MTEIKNCRICKGEQLEQFIDLGDQAFTGIFPSDDKKLMPYGKLSLVKCSTCGLVQMENSYELDDLYGENYGYRSGLNKSMVQHLQTKIARLEQMVNLQPNDVVLDIGSNDATTLKSYTSSNLKKIGIDPSAEKFKHYYDHDMSLIVDFYSAENFLNASYNKPAKIITSIAMFYDLEDPNKFVEDIFKSLDDQGVWHFEQSYLPSMIRANAYDTICHEHLEYYSLDDVQKLLTNHDFEILSIEFNNLVTITLLSLI